MFEALVGTAAILAGGIASLSGFGIGSLLTPIFALRMDLKLAVAAVSIPHVAATALRFWLLRRHVAWREIGGFGIASAAGGLTGALLASRLRSPALSVLFGVLLVYAGVAGLTGLARRLRFGRKTAWVAGAASGVLGGLVGNQGGIRSAGLLGFELSKEAFVASATAIALVVDAARMPVYFALEHDGIRSVWLPILVATAGGIAGTLLGARVLKRIPEPVYRSVVSVLLLVLGVVFLVLSIREMSR